MNTSSVSYLEHTVAAGSEWSAGKRDNAIRTPGDPWSHGLYEFKTLNWMSRQGETLPLCAYQANKKVLAVKLPFIIKYVQGKKAPKRN